MNNENLKNFIEKYSEESIIEIVSCTTKKYNGEIGLKGKYYDVQCKVESLSFGLSTEPENTIEEKQCLVNKKEYKRYLNRMKSIVWL